MVEIIIGVFIIVWMGVVSSRLYKQNKLTQTLIDEVIKWE